MSADAVAPGPAARPCALCGRDDSVPALDVDGFAIVRCRGCALTYVAQPPDDDELVRLYDAAYWDAEDTPGYRGYADEAERKRHHFRTLVARLGSLHDPGVLLEVGCAYGFFLDEARAAGWSVRGVEPSAPAARHAREVLGLDVHDGPLTSAPHPPGSFDAVVLWDVIEHLPDPVATVRHAAGLLRPGGVLGLSTGDVDSLTARIQGRDWSLYTPPWHLFYFSERTLRATMDRAGLEVLAVEGDGVVAADPMAARERLPRWLSRCLTGRLATGVGRAVGAGMIKYVYARKPAAVSSVANGGRAAVEPVQ